MAEPVRIPLVLLKGLDYGAITRSELSARNRYLPPDLADRALRPHVTELSKWLETVMRRQFHPDEQDAVLARKLGGGSRPLPFLTLRDRLVYRALVGIISPPDQFSRGDHEEFKRAPLDVDDCRYVLKTDVTAFYQYVDHERLIDEVVSQTGSDLAVVSAIELLQAVTGRRFGLPQMSSPSDALSEMYIDPIRRDLIRAGFSVARFADDFRVACPDYRGALAALEIAERSAFSLGLVLNEGKTSTPSRETYLRSLQDFEQAEAQLFALIDGKPIAEVDADDLQASIDDFFSLSLDDYAELEDEDDGWEDESSFGDFGGDPDDEQDLEVPHDSDEETPTTGDAGPSERQLQASELLLDLWHKKSDEQALPDGIDWSRGAWSSLLRKSLAVLSAGESDAALQYVPQMLVYEPELTPQLCAHMVHLSASDPAGVSAVLDTVCERESVSAWQSLWIAYCAGALPVVKSTSAAEHVDWLRKQLIEPHHAVAVQAALSLAKRRSLSLDDAADLYRRVPAVHRSTAFLAMAAVCKQQRIEVPTEGLIEGWMAAWVESQQWARPHIVFRRKRPKR